MELSKLYQAILAAVNVEADDNGLLSLVYDGTPRPVTVDGKRLVLPTPAILREGIGANQIAFHPLSENVARGQSQVIKKFKTFVTLKLTQVMSDLIENFTRLLIDHKRHAKLSPEQKELLLTMPDADEKTHQTLEKIFEALRDNPQAKLVSIYLRRKAVLRLETFARGAIISFPIMGEFENDERTIYGVKCRKADFLGFHRLLEYILPSAENVATYSHGSNDPDVPYFDALLRAFVRVAEQLNSRTETFKKHLDNPQSLLIDLSWVNETHSWSKFRGLIPPLPGNEGPANAEEIDEDATTGAPAPQSAVRAFNPERAAASQAPTPTPTSAAAPAPAGAGTPEIRKTSGGLSWQDVVNASNRRSLQPAAAPVALSPIPAAVSYTYGPPVTTYPANPGYPPVNAGGYAVPGPVPPGFEHPVTHAPVNPGYGAPDPRAVQAAIASLQAAGYRVDQYGRAYDVNGQPVPMDPYGRPMVDPYGRQFAPQPAAMAPGMMANAGGPLPPGFGPDPRTMVAYGPAPGDRRPSFGPQATAYGGGYYMPPGYGGVGSGAVPVYGYNR